MDRLVECVPNFSEGRKPETIDALVHAIQAVPGVVVLDRQSDADHNRSVLTFIGPPESVGEAAFRAAEEALHRINLTTHRGEHPRVGATDVIPFVPIRGVTLDDCVHLARLVGRSEEHTSELQSQSNLVCRLLLEKKKKLTEPVVEGSAPTHI